MNQTTQTTPRPLDELDRMLREDTGRGLEADHAQQVRRKVDAMIAEVANFRHLDRKTVEQGLTAVEIKARGRTTRLRLGGGLNHGPIEDIWPGHCHITIILCNPLPFGPQVCIEIEAPWPCGPE